MIYRHVCIFAKVPWPGVAKTRLVPPLSSSQAAALSRAMLADVLVTARKIPHCTRTLAYTPRGARQQMGILAGPGWRLWLQRGNNLGERLSYAVDRLLRADCDQVVVLGSDSPLITAERIEEAFECLTRADTVVGPCEDGGFYLLGLRRWEPELLTGIRWSTCHAFSDLMANVCQSGLAVAHLASELDVDDFASLLRLVEILRSMPDDFAMHTRTELACMGRQLGL